MATIKHLEKLLQIEKLFYVEDSLEAGIIELSFIIIFVIIIIYCFIIIIITAVAGERVTKIIQRTEQMIKQRAFLREERRRIR